jgi:hypothetical protein
MARYAETTSVSIATSKVAIEELLTKHGADAVASISRSDSAEIVFEMKEQEISYRVRFKISMPDFNDDEFRITPVRRTRRSPKEQRAAWEQAGRQRWRALHLMIRAKLEAIESGLTTLEDEFLANLVLPDGHTVGESIQPRIRQALADHEMPRFAIGAGNE